jgi:hypothetical protein
MTRNRNRELALREAIRKAEHAGHTMLTEAQILIKDVGIDQTLHALMSVAVLLASRSPCDAHSPDNLRRWFDRHIMTQLIIDTLQSGEEDEDEDSDDDA